MPDGFPEDIDPPEDIGGVPEPEDIDWGPVLKPLDEGDPCPECGYPFDSDEWEVRKPSTWPSVGESWYYTCPECEKETCHIGT